MRASASATSGATGSGVARCSRDCVMARQPEHDEQDRREREPQHLVAGDARRAHVDEDVAAAVRIHLRSNRGHERFAHVAGAIDRDHCDADVVRHQ